MAYRICMWALFSIAGISVYFGRLYSVTVGAIIMLIPLIVSVVLESRSVRVSQKITKLDFWCGMLLTVFILSLFRGLLTGEMTIGVLANKVVAILGIFFFMALYAKRIKSIKTIWMDVAISLFVFMGVNIVAKFGLNIRSPEEFSILKKTLESTIGLTAYRIYPPFVYTIRSTTFLLALLSMILYYFTLVRKEVLYKIMCFIGVCMISLAIAILDARMVLLISLFQLLFFTWIYFQKNSTTLKLVVFVTMFSFQFFPIIYPYTVFLFPEIFPEGFDTSLTGRMYIWGVSFIGLLKQSFSTLFLGSGFFGHSCTGIMDDFKAVLLHWNGKPAMHNFFLQALSDIGAIGIIIFDIYFVFLIRKTVSLYEKNRLNKKELGLLLSISLLVFGIGMTETPMLTHYHFEMPMLYFLPYFYIINIKSKTL